MVLEIVYFFLIPRSSPVRVSPREEGAGGLGGQHPAFRRRLSGGTCSNPPPTLCRPLPKFSQLEKLYNGGKKMTENDPKGPKARGRPTLWRWLRSGWHRPALGVGDTEAKPLVVPPPRAACCWGPSPSLGVPLRCGRWGAPQNASPDGGCPPTKGLSCERGPSSRAGGTPRALRADTPKWETPPKGSGPHPPPLKHTQGTNPPTLGTGWCPPPQEWAPP